MKDIEKITFSEMLKIQSKKKKERKRKKFILIESIRFKIRRDV